MADKSKPAFPTLIQVGRGNPSTPPAWEVIDPGNRDQRIGQLEQDPTVIWFYAYDVKSYTIAGTKKTIVVCEKPTGADAEGEV